MYLVTVTINGVTSVKPMETEDDVIALYLNLMKGRIDSKVNRTSFDFLRIDRYTNFGTLEEHKFNFSNTGIYLDIVEDEEE